jgi:hypothetical protein
LVDEGVAVCHAFCFMPTHYHVLGTFDDVMRQPFSFVNPQPILEMVGSAEAIREFVTKDL